MIINLVGEIEFQGALVNYEVNLDCEGYYQPAKLWGRPEDCCPEDSSFDVTDGKVVVATYYGADEEETAMAPEQHEALIAAIVEKESERVEVMYFDEVAHGEPY